MKKGALLHAPLRLNRRDEAIRTPDPYVPNVVRYQLRYIPMPNEGQLQTATLLTQLAFSA